MKAFRTDFGGSNVENFVLKRFRERFCSLKPIFYLEMGFEGRFGGAKCKFPNMGIEHLKKPRHNAVFSGIKKPPVFGVILSVQSSNSQIREFDNRVEKRKIF